MKKYLSVFKISFAQEFAYRLSFVMWRVRNVMQIVLVFFLWDSVFSGTQKIIFGYDKAKIITYVFGLIIVRAFVLSARAQDVAGEIQRGEIVNLLLKPVSYFKYWITRDISSKALNLLFATCEWVILYLILKPEFFFQKDPVSLGGFFLLVALAMFIFFVLIFIVSAITFWMPEAGWGMQFLIIVVAVEFLSGGLFPLDILPSAIQKILYLTPFPYLIFFPLQAYLGKISGLLLIKGIIVSAFWALTLWLLMKTIWYRGLKVYNSPGK